MPVRTYLDTCVVRAAYEADGDDGVRALELMDDPDREFVVSDILRLELLPVPTYERRAEESEFYERFFQAATVNVPMESRSAVEALAVGGRYGLGAGDALHIEAARFAGAQEFITIEKRRKPLFRVSEPGLAIVSARTDGE